LSEITGGWLTLFVFCGNRQIPSGPFTPGTDVQFWPYNISNGHAQQ